MGRKEPKRGIKKLGYYVVLLKRHGEPALKGANN